MFAFRWAPRPDRHSSAIVNRGDYGWLLRTCLRYRSRLRARAISVQGTASIGPAEGQSNCRFFLQNVLILSPDRPGMLWCFMSTSPHHPKRDEQGE